MPGKGGPPPGGPPFFIYERLPVTTFLDQTIPSLEVQDGATFYSFGLPLGYGLFSGCHIYAFPATNYSGSIDRANSDHPTHQRNCYRSIYASANDYSYG